LGRLAPPRRTPPLAYIDRGRRALYAGNIKHKHITGKTVRGDQRGIAQLFIVIIGVLVIFMIIAVAVSVSQGGQKSSGGTVVDSAKASACVKNYKDNDLCNFSASFNIDKLSYKLSAMTTDANGSGSTIYLSDGKGNTSVADTSGDTISNFIIYNGQVYLKDDSDGQWFKFARGDKSAPTNTNPALDFKFDTGSASTSISYKKLATEKCDDGLKCFKYQLIDSTQPAVIQYFWFDVTDYKLRHYSYKDGDTTSDVAISYLPVRIKAPTPTKDFPTDNGSDTSSNSSSDSSSSE
jgi:hypothetical protein